MTRRLSADSRRAVMAFSAKENVTYITALEMLIFEGVKAVGIPMDKQAEKSCINA